MPQIKQFIACKNAKTATVKPFCEIKNITDTTADLYFYGDIVSDWWGAWQEEDQYPDAIKNFLAEANGRDLNIYINSGGGSVFAGIAIYNMLKRYQGKKHCFVDALAGSIASLFPFVDSDKPTIPKNAYLMIHKPWCECDPWTVIDRKSAGQSEGGGGERVLYLRFVGTWDGYPVRERWGVCTEMITLFRLEST